MDHHPPHQAQAMGWACFAAMIIVSAAVMFVLMYQLVYEVDHVFFSLNRLVASLIMACVMVVIMLGFMWPMYRGTALKLALVIGAAVVAAALIATNRAQSLIGDVSFMRAMTPHHSIAVNNASKATLRDPRVRQLADNIIRSQLTEITEMKLLIADITQNGPRGATPLPPAATALTPEMEARAREAVK